MISVSTNESKTFTLANGVPCFVTKTPAPGTAVHLLVGEGATNDSETRAGETHLLEHLFFAPRADMAVSQTIPARIEQLGGLFNAAVLKEYSSYWIECLPESAAQTLTLLQDLITSAFWEQQIIENEYALIEEEYSLYQTDNQIQLSDAMESASLTGPASYSLFSQFSGLSERTPDVFSRRHKEHWTRAPLTVHIVGAIPDQIEDMLAPSLGTLAHLHNVESSAVSTWKEQLPKIVEITSKDLSDEQELAWLLPLPELPLGVDSLAAHLFGANMSARVTDACRKAGVGYTYSADTVSYRGISYLYLSTSIPKEKEELCRETIETAIASFTSSPLKNEELERAKTILRANILREAHSASEVAEIVSHSVFTRNQVASPTALIKNVLDYSLTDAIELTTALATQERVRGRLKL